MQVQISALHFNLIDEAKATFQAQIEAALGDKSMKISSALLTVDLQNGLFKSVIVVNAKYSNFEASAEDADLGKSITAAITKVETQVSKKIDKYQDHQGKPLRELE